MLLLSVIVLALGSSAGARSDASLDAVLERFDHDEHADLSGVVVLHRGAVVAERYYNGETADTLHDIRSAGKSVTSLLTGIAIDRGNIRSVADPVDRYWREAEGSAIGGVSLRDVLTMRSGLAAFDEDPESPGNEDRMDEARDPLAFALSVPRADAPGKLYRYNSVTAYAAGVVVAKAMGETLSDFARTALFAPLGIERFRWAQDAAGYTRGQGKLSLPTRGLASIGEMVRQEGCFEGRRIVSAAWVSEALSPKESIADVDPYADGYGYFWYTKTQSIDGKPVLVRFASGNGGNKIYVVPERQMVVAITSSAYGRGYGQRRSESILRTVLSEFDASAHEAGPATERALESDRGACASRRDRAVDDRRGGPDKSNQVSCIATSCRLRL